MSDGDTARVTDAACASRFGRKGWLQWFGGCALKLSFMFIASIVG